MFRTIAIAYVTWFLLKAAVNSHASVEAIAANVLWGILILASILGTNKSK